MQDEIQSVVESMTVRNKHQQTQLPVAYASASDNE